MAGKKDAEQREPKGKEEASDRIFTVPNLISFIRLCLVPIFLVLLFNGYDVMATFLSRSPRAPIGSTGRSPAARTRCRSSGSCSTRPSTASS